jgi:hypothetical protein
VHFRCRHVILIYNYGFVVAQPLAKRDNRIYGAEELEERAGAGVVELEESTLSHGEVPEKNVKTVAFIQPAPVV